jgi:Voltage-dependent anion channel
VLDTRLSANLAMLRVLGIVAFSAWLVLIMLSVRNMSAHRWTALRDDAHGAWELASVGTSGSAIVVAQVAYHNGHRWWLLAAVPIWLVAIAIYILMTWLVMWRAVVERRDRDGFAPDSWIMMGALAIATLAGDQLHEQVSGSLAAAVRIITVITWAAATLWIPPLIYFGLHRITQRPDVLQSPAPGGHWCFRWGCIRRPPTPWRSRWVFGRCRRFRWFSFGMPWRYG